MSQPTKPATQHCALCGVEREEPMLGTSNDNLRTVYVANRALDAGFYRPRLSEFEMQILIGLPGHEHYVCTGRRACNKRRAAAEKAARS